MKILTLLLIFTSPLFSQTFTLQPDGINGKDSKIVNNKFQDTNYGLAESLNSYTWTISGDIAVKRFLIDFNLEELPLQNELISAYISFYYNPTDPYEGIETHSGNTECYIERIISEWEEGTVTWNNQPQTTELNRVQVPSVNDNTQDLIKIDVTNLYKDIINNQDNSFGLMLRMKNESDPYRMLILGSSNNTNPNLRPKLELKFKTTTSTDLQIFNDKVFVYPNITMDPTEIRILNGHFQPKFDGFTAIIRNMEGKLIYTGLINLDTIGYQWDLIKSGYYLISVANKFKILGTKKVLILR